jgi:hypothetical protein
VAKKNPAKKKSAKNLSVEETNCVVIRLRRYGHRGEGPTQLA